MNRIAVCVLLLVLVSTAGCAVIRPQAAAPAPTDSTAPLVLSEADSGKEIVLKQGDKLEVDLQGNPSTGYNWVSKQDWDEGVLQLTSKSSEATSGLIGAPEDGKWLFNAKSAGEVKLELAYQRPWEKDAQPERTFTLSVKVQ